MTEKVVNCIITFARRKCFLSRYTHANWMHTHLYMLYLCLEEFITSFSLPPEGERLRVFGNLGDLFFSLAELYSPLRKKTNKTKQRKKQWR